MQKKEKTTGISYQSEEIFIKCLSNITALRENHALLFTTKVPQYLFNYLRNEFCIRQDCYKYAVMALLNIAHGE